MMVLVASRSAGQRVKRAEQTKDADILVDLCANPQVLAKVVHELRQFGFDAIEDFGGKEVARCTFVGIGGQGQIDVLCPEDATSEELDSAPGVRSLAIPGGRRALQLSELVRIRYDDDAADVEIRVPLLPGAIAVKAAAAVAPATVGQPRHIQDVADMLAILEEPMEARDVLCGADLTLLSDLAGRFDDDGDIAWQGLAQDDRMRARAALNILIS